MSGLDDLFTATEYNHPKLRVWEQRFSAGVSATVEVRRQRDGFMTSHPTLHVEFRLPDGHIDADAAEWEDELNDALIDRGIRACSLSNEAERFSIALHSYFSPLSTRYGDDYFNSVLISLIDDMGITLKPELEDVLSQITAHKPHQSTHYDDCRDDIKAVLAKTLRRLCERLKYSRGAATDIVTAALAMFLDERFSVTSRRLLGWANGPQMGFWSLIQHLAPNFPGSPTLAWTALPEDLAVALRSYGLNTTVVTLERELLEHSAHDATFPWKVTLDPQTRTLHFEPKVQ